MPSSSWTEDWCSCASSGRDEAKGLQACNFPHAWGCILKLQYAQHENTSITAIAAITETRQKEKACAIRPGRKKQEQQQQQQEQEQEPLNPQQPPPIKPFKFHRTPSNPINPSNPIKPIKPIKPLKPHRTPQAPLSLAFALSAYHYFYHRIAV